MKKTNTSDLEWDEMRSPTGKFHVFRRHLSLALGAPRDAGVAGGGHPFDLEMTRLPPGATNCPYHAHAAQWEAYIVLSGAGEVRAGGEIHSIRAGDTFMCEPGVPHHIRNTASPTDGEDLVYYVIADNPPVDVIEYPDSGKWTVKPLKKIFEMIPKQYYDGEE